MIFPVPAAALEVDNHTYEAMFSCFTAKANSFDGLVTPLDDMADVILGTCWEQVNEHRQRWTKDWAALVDPYFILQVTAKAK